MQARFSRGHIELSINFNGSGNAPKQFKLDLESAEAYHRILKKLKTSLHLSGEIDVALMSHFKEIITTSEPEEDTAPLGRFVDRMVERSMRALEKMRGEEGGRSVKIWRVISMNWTVCWALSNNRRKRRSKLTMSGFKSGFPN
ncbi:MAG: hypothetical protein MPW17_05490 [Candidatus Manganitrophus sp.]|nr:MAG: hypothetical protein MPW17_05490 [Candidatus Manganitrophus sp.]